MTGPRRVFDLDPEKDAFTPAPGAKSVRPRPAATLLLLDRAGAEVKVLMGRRHRGHDFMPDLWVFPGGRVDRADYRRPALSELTPETLAALGSTLPPGRASLARALGAAAVRETWEEAGLILGQPQASGPPKPDLAALRVLARAITPPYRPKRFDAVFFTADAARLHGEGRIGGTGELNELAWFTLPEAMRLDLPAVTRFVLKELAETLADPSRPPLYMRFRRGAHLVTPFGG